jgi:hypothetical protein
MNQPNQPAPPFGYQPAFQQGPYPYPAGSYPVDITSPNSMPAVWPNAYYQQGVGVDDEDENILTKKIAGLPVWGWGTIAAVVGVGGWLVYKQMQPGGMLAKNDDAPDTDDDDDDEPVQANKGWSPSRSRFGTHIDAFLKQNGIKGVKVYIDADDAVKAGVKTPSPLITMRTSKAAALHTNPQFIAMCEAEGLKPIETTDNIVGLYPNKSAKKHKGKADRGEMQENYINDLRDEGQKV